MAFLKEFKEFALKGNVMDMAVGVIIGGAFGKIVSSLVNDILMPPIGALIGNTDFSQLRLDISKFRDMTSSAVHAVGDVVTGGGKGGCRARLLELRRLHPAVHRLHDSGILRLPDGQADEPADAEKGRGRRSGACSRTRTHEGGVAADGDPRPAQGAEEIITRYVQRAVCIWQAARLYLRVPAVPMGCGKGGEPAAQPGGLIGRTPFCAYTPVIYKW